MFPQPENPASPLTATIVPFVDKRSYGITFDPRSHYAETFWLPILGPSTMWLLRKVADRFDTEPDGFELDLIETSRSLGIGSNGGKNNAFSRALKRVVNFDVGKEVDEHTIAIRRALPTLHQGHVRRLSPRLANLHDETIRSQRTHRSEDLIRSTNVALTLLNLGDSADVVQQQLISWGVDPKIALVATRRAHNGDVDGALEQSARVEHVASERASNVQRARTERIGL